MRESKEIRMILRLGALVSRRLRIPLTEMGKVKKRVSFVEEISLVLDILNLGCLEARVT